MLGGVTGCVKGGGVDRCSPTQYRPPLPLPLFVPLGFLPLDFLPLFIDFLLFFPVLLPLNLPPPAAGWLGNSCPCET